MNQMKHKLYSQRGVTILMALLFLLICAMVSSAVLASANANTDKNTERKDSQKSYQALASAIRFLQDTVDGTVCVASESKHTRDCLNRVDIIGNWHVDEFGVVDMTMADNDAALHDYLTQQANRIYKTQTQFYKHSKEPLPSGITTSFTIEAEGVPEVAVSLWMKRDYSLQFQLSVKDSAYSAVLEFSCAKTEQTKTETEDMGCEHEVSILMDDGTPGVETEHFAGEKTTLLTELVWNKGRLTKGGGNA